MHKLSDKMRGEVVFSKLRDQLDCSCLDDMFRVLRTRFEYCQNKV